MTEGSQHGAMFALSSRVCVGVIRADSLNKQTTKSLPFFQQCCSRKLVQKKKKKEKTPQLKCFISAASEKMETTRTGV